MSDRFERQSSIVKHIIDGSVRIDSIEDFENILKLFPNDPALYRASADLLARQKSFDGAANAYGIAAKLFIDSGMTLQAIVSKILEWRIVEPSHREAKAFYSALREGRSQGTPLQKFLTMMTYPEMVAIMVRFVRVRLHASRMVKKFGDVENNIYFVVSGALKETTYHPLEEGERVHKKSTTELVENDFFGDIYPFEEEKVSQSDVETITHVELVKISRSRFMTICKKYPNVELLVNALYKARSEPGDEISSQTVRRTTRQEVPIKVNMNIFREEAGKAPLVLDGFTEDISLGGACIVLGAKYRTGPPTGIIGRNVKIQMGLPAAGVRLNILGTIVWSKEFSHEGKTTIVVGIQFKDMTGPDRELLEEYCYGSDGEQNLIWSLWESLVKR